VPEELQYELLIPSGWERTRKQRGTIKLASAADAFATIAVTLVPLIAEQVPTPTMVLLAQASVPIRCGMAWVEVA
jgi:hypothetical protein